VARRASAEAVNSSKGVARVVGVVGVPYLSVNRHKLPAIDGEGWLPVLMFGARGDVNGYL
jgi:hypothetical protein